MSSRSTFYWIFIILLGFAAIAYLSIQEARKSSQADFDRLAEAISSTNCLAGITSYFRLKPKSKEHARLFSFLEYDLTRYENACKKLIGLPIDWHKILQSPKLKNSLLDYLTLLDIDHCDHILDSSEKLLSRTQRSGRLGKTEAFIKQRKQTCYGDFAEQLPTPTFRKDYLDFLNLDGRDCQPVIDIGERLMAMYQQNPKFPFIYMLPIYTQAAYCYQQNWLHHRAAAAFEKIEEQTGDPNLARVITTLRESINSNQLEREHNDRYHVSRDIGHAKGLIGRVAIVMVFIDLKDAKWGKLDRLQSLSALNIVKTWYANQAKRHAINSPTFSTQEFHLGSTPIMEMQFQAMRHARKQKNNQHLPLAITISKTLGHPTPAQLSTAMKKELNVDQVMLYFNFKIRARSFASYCYNNMQRIHRIGNQIVKREDFSTCQGEYTFVFANPKKQRWHSYHHTIAHEGLHLFGADDLYKIRQAKDYATEDIMNYYVKFIEYSRVQDMTAYAIGWKKEAPNTPFSIIAIGN